MKVVVDSLNSYLVKLCFINHIKSMSLFCVAERAAKVAEQQERDRAHQTSPRAGTPVGALMGVVPPPTPMGMLNPSMTHVSGNPS